MGWTRRIGIAALVAAVALPLSMVVSARCALDRELTHTRRTAELPLLSAATSDGQVRIPARGHHFRARVAGLRNSGPALLLLHGFPETSIMWEPLIEAATAAGFRVAAFDQRGYSPGARPADVGAYAVPELVDDVRAVADALGFERFHLVGHDWGSMPGWVLASEEPDRVISWASLSIPHPRATVDPDADAGLPLYMRVFRMPGVAETLFGAFDFFLLRATYGAMPPAVREEYLAVFSEPEALTAALDWYRAIPDERDPASLAPGPVDRPVLYVFGRHDMPVFVNPDVRVRQRPLLLGPYTELELDAGHWLIQEEPKAVVGAVMAHLERHRSE